jgi:hypothetical protein
MRGMDMRRSDWHHMWYPACCLIFILCFGTAKIPPWRTSETARIFWAFFFFFGLGIEFLLPCIDSRGATTSDFITTRDRFYFVG